MEASEMIGSRNEKVIMERGDAVCSGTGWVGF